MLDLLSLISTLNRPRLLVSAARFGVDDYRREAHLPRLLGLPTPTRGGEAILRLLEVEADLDARRRLGTADYPASRHVSVLTALLGEARLLRPSRVSAGALT